MYLRWYYKPLVMVYLGILPMLIWIPGIFGTDHSGNTAGSDLCQNSSNFRCDADGTECVLSNAKCDGVSQCTTGWDESVETCGCLSSEFLCNETTCIDGVKQCDTFPDCIDGVDEENCASHICPQMTHIRCRNHYCIPREKECDFVDDCGDNSDEEMCVRKPCVEVQFECHSGQCILMYQLCNGQEDCVDGSDETEEACSQGFSCGTGHNIFNKFKCDRWTDCTLTHSDEVNCSDHCEFVCPNGRCLASANVCDGVCDCLSCRDEANCSSYSCNESGRNLCRYGGYHPARCLRSNLMCNGENDCRDGGAWDLVGCDKTGPEACRENEFFCPEGRCLKNKYRCDFVRDCELGEDEQNCTLPPCSATEFRCDGGQCIPMSKRCDLNRDCLDWTDEVNCGDTPCPSGHNRCASGQCIPGEFWCDYHPDCLDVSDEINCEYHSNPRPCTVDEFRCNSGQCIPKSQVCFMDRDQAHVRLGCNDKSHLVNCSDQVCEGEDLWKCPGSYCIYSSRVCDHSPDCHHTLHDEDDCEYKCGYKDRCTCLRREMNCEQRELVEIPKLNLNKEHSTKLLFSGNMIQLNTTAMNQQQELSSAIYLDLSNNSLSEIPPGCFDSLWRLTYLSLSNNNLTMLGRSFTRQTSLTQLYLTGNKIASIQEKTFESLIQLTALDLSDQELTYLYKNMFQGLKKVTILDLARNKISEIEDGAFNSLVSLVLLDLTGNRIQHMDPNVFMGLSQLATLVSWLGQNYTGLIYDLPINSKTDAYRFCCLVHDDVTCTPEPDEFSSCEDLMSNHILRISIWVLGVIALFGNFVVVLWRFMDFQGARIHSFLIANLAIGDFLMGVYLVIIAAVDAHYRGVYIIYSDQWRDSALCKFAGFISTFSSELSVLTLTTITLDRLMCIVFPLKQIKLGLKQAVIVMGIIWLIVFFLALLPLLGFEYFEGFYGRSGVCLALHVTPDRPAGWEFSVAVFLVLNLTSFLVIACSYVRMFCVAKKTRSAVRTTERQNDTAMAKRMTLIVMTDFFCWIPIIALGMVSLFGVRADNEVYAWIAVFVLPLNSATNPIIYTLSTAPFLGNVRKRATRFRKSFALSFNGESKHSYVEERTSHSFCERKSNYRELELIRLRSLNGSPTPVYGNRAT